MDRTRIPIMIEVDLDPVHGEFHTKESAEYNIQKILSDAIGHYNPKVVTGLPIASMPPGGFDSLRKALEGGIPGLIATMQDMLANPELAEHMQSMTQELVEALPQEGDEAAPDAIPAGWSLPSCGHLECADHPETCPDRSES